MSFGQNADLIAALDELDSLLSQRGRPLEIIVCGGFVHMQRYAARKAEDIDVLWPCYEGALGQAIKKVAANGKISNLQPDWLNWKAGENLGLTKGLSPGWEERARSEGVIYQGPLGHLVVYGLCRMDLIAIKLAALLASKRKLDLDDLAAMGMTDKEEDAATDTVIQLLKHRSWVISTPA